MSITRIKIADIVVDGGTQVREVLDGKWVTELAELYADERVMPAIVVVVDPADNHWLADGFHRRAALVSLGVTEIEVDLREGTLELAKWTAAAANTHGQQRTSGDKKRAILMARGTAIGAAMGVRELSRHCGIDVAWVSRVLAETEVLSNNTSKVSSDVALKSAPRPFVQAIWDRADEAIRADPESPNRLLAGRAKCSADVVAKRKTALGVKPLARADGPKWRADKAAPQESSAQADPVNCVGEPSAHEEAAVSSAAPQSTPVEAKAVPIVGIDAPKPPIASVDHALVKFISDAAALGARRREEAFDALRLRYPEFREPVDDHPSLSIGGRLRAIVNSYLSTHLEPLDPATHHSVRARVIADLDMFLDAMKFVDGHVRRAIDATASAQATMTRIEVKTACETLAIEPPPKGKPADLAVANAARKTLGRQYHPDRHGGEEGFREQFELVMQAYRTLEIYNEGLTDARSLQRNGAPHA